MVTPSVDNRLLKEAQRAGTFSLALHSRHTVLGDDGSYITDEIKCLEKLLPSNRAKDKCFVFLMSDRPKTIDALTRWLGQKNCTALANTDNELSTSSSIGFTDEMGPNQGTFWNLYFIGCSKLFVSG
jgi:hypothetical protein